MAVTFFSKVFGTKDETYQRIQERESDFKDLYKRMDEDRKLYLMDEYKLKNYDGQEVPDVVNVTMNDARVFADRANAILNGANMQAVITGRHLSDKETTLIEQFIEDLLITIDDRLLARDLGALYSFLIEQIIVRGRISSRNLVYEDKETGLYVPDVLPCDTRYMVYEFSHKGLMWANPFFMRSKAQIEKEYGDKARRIMSSLPKLARVDDFWDDEKEVIYINKTKIDEKENTMGFPPFVIQKSGAGSMLMDEGYLKYTGESVFAPNRSLYPELNRLATILQTLNMMTFAGGYQYESELGEDATKPEEPVHGLWKVWAVEKGGGYRLIPVNDIRNSTRLFFSLLLGAVQRGSLPNIDYGNLTFPLSAVAISRLTATKDAIFVPRLQALSLYYRQTARMLRDQYVKGGITTKLGEEGLKREYNASDLDKEFAIQYHFYSTSPEQDVANYAIAQQAMAVDISMDTIRRDILKLRDPDGEKIKSRAERAEKGDAALMLYEQGHSMIDEYERTKDGRYLIKSELILQQLEGILRNRAGGGMAGLDMEALGGGRGTQAQTKSLVPLLEGGGAGASRGVTPERESSMPPEELEERAESRASTVRRQSEEG